MSDRLGYPSSWIEKIDNETLFSTENGLPGAVVSLNLNGQNIFRKKYGYQKKYNKYQLMPEFEPMRADTIFDLASLTKIFSTTLAFMQLVSDNLVSVEDKVRDYLSDFSGGDKDGITLRQLLNHNSGLPSGYRFFDPKAVPPDFFSQDREKTIGLLPKIPLACKPGTRTIYSDINFAILGVILEKVTALRQDHFVEKNIYEPLGLKNTGYALLQKGFKQNQFEASERNGNTRDGHVTFPNIRTDTIQGEVQDETAYYSMEQISGNAGLFSTAEDLEVLCQLLLNRGSYGTFTLCSEHVSDCFFRARNIDDTYALGFEIPGGNTVDSRLIYGMLLPEAGDAYGHTGWTGKCFLIDFRHNSSMIVLTNKKHTPVINLNNRDFNRFEGDLLPTSIYGGIAQLFYAGLVERQSHC